MNERSSSPPWPERPVRIVRILTRCNIGGPSVHVGILATQLDPTRFSTLVVTGQSDAIEGDLSRRLVADGARVVQVRALQRAPHPWRDVQALAQIMSLLWRERPHIIHTHMAKAGTLGRLAGLLYNTLGPGRTRSCRAILVHTFHGHVLERYFGRPLTHVFLMIERWLARRTDGLIAVSRTVQEELLQLGIGRPSQWQVIPLGLPLSALAVLPLANGRMPLRAGLVGRLVAIKNPSLFLQALERLRRDAGGQPSVHGLVIGDGPLRAGLEQESRQRGLDALVQFTGWQQDLVRLYQQIDVACLTSWNEGTPAALIEAMAAGRPVIATAVGGVRDVVEDGPPSQPPLVPGCFEITTRGILVIPGDVAGLAAALQRIASDERLRRRLAEAGRAFVTQQFTSERLIAAIGTLYGQLEAQRIS